MRFWKRNGGEMAANVRDQEPAPEAEVIDQELIELTDRVCTEIRRQLLRQIGRVADGAVCLVNRGKVSTAMKVMEMLDQRTEKRETNKGTTRESLAKLLASEPEWVEEEDSRAA